MNASRTVSRGASDRSRTGVPVFESLREQIEEARHDGVGDEDLACALVAIMDGTDTLADYPVRDLVFRLAWVVTVHAPAHDPVLVATLPFCLESIVEGFLSMDDLFDHIDTADPVSGAPLLPRDLPWRMATELEGEVHRALDKLRNDPQVLERIIDRIGGEDLEDTGSWSRAVPLASRANGAGRSVVQRLPPAVREAVVSVLEVEPAPGAVPLMQQIAGRLDGRSLRRLAGELVHISADGEGLRLRVRAAASLLAMSPRT